MHPQDKFTKERCDAILKSVASRVPNKYAAKAAGLNEEKLYHWLKQGAEDIRNNLDTPKAKFCVDFSKIEHDLIKEQLDMIHAKPNRWQAHAWILERRWWREFSPNGPLKELAKKIEQMELSADIKEQLHVEIKSCKKEQTPRE